MRSILIAMSCCLLFFAGSIYGSVDEPTTYTVSVTSYKELLREFGIYNIEVDTEHQDFDTSPSVAFHAAYLLGNIFLEGAQLREAQNEFTRALEFHEKSALALLAIAQTKFILNKYEECINLCDAILSNNLRNVDALLLKAKTLNVRGDWKEAKKVYERVIKYKPYNLEALRALGNIAYSQDSDFRQARDYYKKVLDIDPKDISALIIVGTTAAMLDEIDEAQQYLFRAIQQNPDFIGPYIRLGNILDSADKTEAAFKVYRQTLIANPKNKQAQLYFSLAATKLKGEDGALQAYAELADEFPDDPEIQLLFANQLISNNKLDEAEKVLDKVVKIIPSNISALISLGDLSLKRNDKDKAQDFFSRAISHAPEEIRYYTQIAQIYSDRNLLEPAAEYLRKALQLEPESSEIFLSLFENYFKSDQYDKAEELVRQAIETNRNKDLLFALLGSIYRVQGKFEDALVAYMKSLDLKNKNLETYLHVISLLFQLEQNQKAEDMVAKAHELFAREQPKEFNIRMGLTFQQWGHYDEATSYIQTVINIDPRYTPAYSELAHIHNLQRNYNAAENVFKIAAQNLGEAAEQVDFYLLEGSMYLEQRNFDKALDSFKTALLKDDSNLMVYSSLILASSEAGNFNDALAYLKRAKDKVGVQNIEIQKLEAQILNDKKEFDKAEEILTTLLQQYPEDISTLYSLAGVYYDSKQYQMAEEIFSKILSIDPNHIDSLNSLGYLLAIQGKRLDEAERYIRKALNLKPSAGYIIDSLGWVYYQRGDYNQALELIEKAYHLALEDIEILGHLGEIYRILDMKDKAIDAYQRLLELDPDNDNVQRLLKGLR